MKNTNMISAWVAALMAAIMLAPFAHADENGDIDAGAGINSDAEIVSANAATNVTVTPDHPLWGLKIAIEKIELALTFNNTRRAEIALQQAHKRLLEVEAMIEQNKFKAAEKAKARHAKILARLESDTDGISDKDSHKEFREKIKIRGEVELHEQALSDIEQKIKVKIGVKGNLTAEQQAKLEAFIESMKNASADVKVKIHNSGEKTRMKLRQEGNESDADEIEKEVGKLNFERRAELALRQAGQQINVTQQILAKRASENRTNTTAFAQTHMDNAISLRTDAQTQFDAGNYTASIRLALRAKVEAQIARIGSEKEAKSRLEIKLRAEKNERNESDDGEENETDDNENESEANAETEISSNSGRGRAGVKIGISS